LLYILDNLDDKVIEVLSKENQKYSELITNKENILANNKQEKKENTETRTENNILVLNNKKEEEKIVSEPNKKVSEMNEVNEQDFTVNEVSLNNEELKEDNRGDLNSNNLKFDEPKVLEEIKIEENKNEDNENIDNKVQEINIDIENNQEEVKKENLEDLNKEKNENKDIDVKIELEDEKKEKSESNEQVISISPKKLETIKAENVEIVQPIKVAPKQLEEINFTTNEENDYSNNVKNNENINNTIEDVYMNNMLNQFKNTRCAIFVGTSKNGISFTVNSLGMLFSSIGINTAVASKAQSIGFAIPISSVKGILKSISKGKEPKRAYLGASYISINQQIRKKYNLDVSKGALVKSRKGNAIIYGSPAQKAGLKDGDIITKIDGVEVSKNSSISSLIGEKSVGDTVEISYIRDGREKSIRATLEEYHK